MHFRDGNGLGHTVHGATECIAVVTSGEQWSCAGGQVLSSFYIAFRERKLVGDPVSGRPQLPHGRCFVFEDSLHRRALGVGHRGSGEANTQLVFSQALRPFAVRNRSKTLSAFAGMRN